MNLKALLISLAIRCHCLCTFDYFISYFTAVAAIHRSSRSTIARIRAYQAVIIGRIVQVVYLLIRNDALTYHEHVLHFNIFALDNGLDTVQFNVYAVLYMVLSLHCLDVMYFRNYTFGFHLLRRLLLKGNHSFFLEKELDYHGRAFGPVLNYFSRAGAENLQGRTIAARARLIGLIVKNNFQTVWFLMHLHFVGIQLEQLGYFRENFASAADFGHYLLFQLSAAEYLATINLNNINFKLYN